MNKYLYFGENEKKTVDFETPLVKKVRQASASPITFIGGIFFILSGVVLSVYYFAFYFKLKTAYFGLLPLLPILSGLCLVLSFAQSRGKTLFYSASAQKAFGILQIIKSLATAATVYWLFFISFNRYPLIRLLKEKYSLYVLLLSVPVVLSVFLTAFSGFTVRRTATDNVPSRAFLIPSAIIFILAAILSVAAAASPFFIKYASFVANRHILFSYSNYIILPSAFAFSAVGYALLAAVMIKYNKAIKKTNY